MPNLSHPNQGPRPAWSPCIASAAIKSQPCHGMANSGGKLLKATLGGREWPRPLFPLGEFQFLREALRPTLTLQAMDGPLNVTALRCPGWIGVG